MVKAYIFGKWVELDDDHYVINGEQPSVVVNKLDVKSSIYTELNNGFVEIARIDGNAKYYIHYTFIQWNNDERGQWLF